MTNPSPRIDDAPGDLFYGLFTVAGYLALFVGTLAALLWLIKTLWFLV